MRYALIGSGGFIAPRHVQAIKDVGSQVVTTVDVDSTKGAQFTDYRELLKSSVMNSIDAISVLTPNYLHPEHVRACLATGKRVLVEKPLSINTDFFFLDGAFIVHQLHFHPLFNEICSKMKKAKEIKMVFKAYRGAEFWQSPWKGDELKSGGVAYVFGSHLFDLLLSAVSGEYELSEIKDTNKKLTGKVRFKDGPVVYFDMEFLDSREGQGRYVEIDGELFQLSIKDNLSFEGLHDKVYKAFESGVKSNVSEEIRCIRLIDEIKKVGRCS